MARSTLIVTVVSLVTLALSFASQLLIMALFGASFRTDAYFVAIAIPLLISNLLGTVSATALVPLFIETKVQQGEDAAWRLVSTLVSLSLLILIVVLLGGGIASRALISVLAPGLPEPTLALAVELFRWSRVMLVLMAFSNIVMVIHHTLNRFTLPTLSMMLPPLGQVGGGLLLYGSLGIHSVILGQTIGAMLQALFLARGLIDKTKLRPLVDLQTPGFASACRMIWPVLLGNLAYQIPPILECFFASWLPPGSISHLVVANRIGNTVVLVLTGGLATTLFPRLSHQVVQDPYGARRTLSLSVKSLILVAAPIVVFSPLYAQPLVQILFERGAFDHQDTLAVARVVPLYLFGITAAAFGRILGQGIVAFCQDTLTISTIGIIHTIMYPIVCYLLVPVFGYIGLALANALYGGSSGLVASLMLRRRLGGSGGGTIVRVTLLCTIICLIIYPLLSTATASSPSLWLHVFAVVVSFLLYITVAWFVVSECRLVARKLLGNK